MSAVAAKPAAGGAMNPTAMVVGIVMTLVLIGICYMFAPVDSWTLPSHLFLIGGQRRRIAAFLELLPIRQPDGVLKLLLGFSRQTQA